MVGQKQVASATLQPLTQHDRLVLILKAFQASSTVPTRTAVKLLFKYETGKWPSPLVLDQVLLKPSKARKKE